MKFVYHVRKIVKLVKIFLIVMNVLIGWLKELMGFVIAKKDFLIKLVVRIAQICVSVIMGTI